MALFSGLGADLRFTARLFRKSVGFSAVAVLSIALGIGASSAIFSLVYAVLIDPYPYRDADRIIAPTFVDQRGRDNGRMDYKIDDYGELRRGSETLEDLFLADERPMVATGGIPDQVRGVAFSPNGFDFMGVPAMLGQTFSERDISVPQTPPRIAVISYRYWMKRFNGDRGAIGKPLALDHQQYTLIGVVPPRFTWNDADVYIPLAMVDQGRSFSTIMRIRQGLKLSAANAELQPMTERFAKRSPDAYPKQFRFQVKDLNDWLLGKFRGTLFILLAAVGFLLLIACGNVSILLLARAGVRQREIAVRLSLGAASGRILRQLLTESVLLSLTGGVLGIALAYAGVPWLVALMPEYSVPHEAAINVNRAVVLFTFAASVLTGILFGMAPALQLARADVRDAIQETGRTIAGSSRAGRARSVLIVGEIALTMILLSGAGVAIRGFVALTSAPLGFDPSDVLMMQMNLPLNSYPTWEARSAYYRRVLQALRDTPGAVSAAATVTALPPRINFRTRFDLPGTPVDAAREARVGLIDADYFATMRVPILRGRTFLPREVESSARVAVINEAMRRKYWPDRDPIGTFVTVPELEIKANPDVISAPGAGQPMQIVGVSGSPRNEGLLNDPAPAIYVPLNTVTAPSMVYMVRTKGDPQLLTNAVRRAVRNTNPDQPLVEVKSLEEQMYMFETAYPRFSTTLFSIFAGVGLLLAVSGLYSVVSYVVARRTHEFGIRVALGATASHVLGIVTRMTGRLLLIGITIGLAGTVALSRVIAFYVPGWDGKDPVAFAAVILVLSASASLAAWFPARRAASIQPMSALRHV